MHPPFPPPATATLPGPRSLALPTLQAFLLPWVYSPPASFITRRPISNPSMPTFPTMAGSIPKALQTSEHGGDCMSLHVTAWHRMSLHGTAWQTGYLQITCGLR